VPHIDEMRSTVNEGVSVTAIRFELERDGNIAKDDVRDAVDRIRADLPKEVEAPIVALANLEGGDIVTFAVAADGWSDEELSWYIDDTVSKRLFGLAGVGAVRRIGGISREVRVDLRPEALQALGVSPATVNEDVQNRTPDDDPERDDVASVKAFVSAFHPRLVGLTGSPAAVEAAQKAYGIYAKKVATSDPGNYLVDHFAVIYLFGPTGEPIAFLPHGSTAADVTAMLEAHVG
jgi:hypothetical protein